MTTPTTAQLTSNIVASISASISQTVPLLPKSFITVLAKVLSAVFILLYKRGDFVGLQWFVKTASIKETTFNGETIIPLVEIGRQIGVSDPTPATQAELLVDITVENQTGTLESGTQLVGANNGVTYILIGSVLLDAPTVQGNFRAVSDQSGGDGSGVQGNLPPGDTSLSFANPLPNVARAVVVDSQVVTGANAEDLDIVYRQRVLDRFQKRPQGGAYADYELWGEETAGIINVYPYTSDCPGQVDLYSEATVESSGNPDGIPTAAQLQAVLDTVTVNENGLASRRPANALVSSLPITRTGFDVRVTGLQVDNLAEVQQTITTALEEYFLSREPFIEGLSILPRKDRITASAVGGVVDDIVSAAGGIFSAVIVSQSGVNVVLYSLGIGEKSKALTVTFI